MNHEKRNQTERMRRKGYEQATPKATYFPASSPLQRAANERLEAFLRYSPRGERDVDALLNTPERRKREKWLRDVLNACED